MRTLVVIPTYQEAGNILQILTAIRTAVPDVDILIVDDNSPDGTASLVPKDDPQIFLMVRPGPKGFAASYRDGFTWAIEQGYGRVVEMDADLSHQPHQLPDLLAAANGGAGLVIGSRWVPGGGTVGWPLGRQLISRSGSLYARLMLGIPLRDITAGYRVIPVSTLRAIDYQTLEAQGYLFQVEVTRRAHRAGVSIVEVPITFVQRAVGDSKMSGRIVREAMWQVTIWGLNRIFRGME